MTQEQIDELRNLAQAATPGPWVVNGDPLVNEGAPHLMTEDGYAIADFWGNESSLGLKGNEQNAAFIATANPAAILALIQQRDELLAEMRVIEDILNRETNTQDMGYELFRRTNFIRRAIETTERKP